MISKEEFRKKYKEVRKCIDSKEREHENQEIYTRFVELDIYKKAKSVFVYVSFNDEVDTHRIIERAVADKKLVAVPLCNKKDRTMKAVLIEDMGCLKKGAYGILEPELKSSCGVIEKDKIDLAVVPGICFSEKGERMGYGGGYYDRFLEDFKGLSVGLAYSDCIDNGIPTYDNDKQVDYVVWAERE